MDRKKMEAWRKCLKSWYSFFRKISGTPRAKRHPAQGIDMKEKNTGDVVGIDGKPLKSNKKPQVTKSPERHKRSAKHPHTQLTDKQEKFATLVCEGHNYSQAYRMAYATENMAENTIWRQAWELSRHRAVAARIADIQAQKAIENNALAATREVRIMETLTDIMANGKTEAARVRAAELLGKSVGCWQGDKENKGGGQTVKELEARLDRLLGKGDKTG